jgi:hypothetical protein
LQQVSHDALRIGQGTLYLARHRLERRLLTGSGKTFGLPHAACGGDRFSPHLPSFFLHSA